MSQRTISFDCDLLAQALKPASLVIRRLDGIVTHWTDGSVQMYGWSAEEAIGQSISKLLQLHDPEQLEHMHRQLLDSGSWQGELAHHRRDGRRVLVFLSSALVQDGEAEQVVVEMHTDITQRVRELEVANERLASMTLELQRSNEELEQFARIASHDLSAPITSTHWLVDLLNARHSQQLDEAGREILRQVSQGLDRMSELIEAVLMHARVGTTAIASADAFPAEAAVQVALENLRKHVQMSHASVHFGNLPKVNIDKQPLCQLFQNLLSNAIKYRQKSIHPEIEISARWHDPMWEFAIRDNGIGIEPAWSRRIFQPLQRQHGGDIAGSGIGLATCKKIVTRAGGDIWVESVPGQGSTFRFTLPGPAQ